MRRVPWVEKYRPRSLSDVVDQDEAKRRLVEWLNSWERGSRGKALLLAGPPGVGKTTLVYALANDKGYEVLELNASDVRTAERIKSVVGKSLREVSLFGFRGKIILVDEVDGLSIKEDKGGVWAIIEVIGESSWPVIMTANNPWDPKFRELRERAELVQLKPLDEADIIEVLRRICRSEGIRCEEDALALIARSSRGDLRAAINDLESVAEGKGAVVKDDVVVSDRAHQYDMFRIMDRVLHSRRFDEARSVSFLPSFDWESFYSWALDNVPRVYQKSPVAINDALENLSLSDVIRGRIIRTQEWELMPYMIELMTAGIALVRDKPSLPRFARLSFPERIRLMMSTKESRQLRSALVERLRHDLHVSSRIVNLEYIPMLRLLVSSETFGRKLMTRLTGLLGSVENVEKSLGKQPKGN